MSARIRRSCSEPIRQNLTFEQRWRQADQGLIFSWETGRRQREQNPERAQRAEAGELPVSGWKGGLLDPLSPKTKKYGPLNYLAEWQGLRGEDLDIDPTGEVRLTCTRTGNTVTFTWDKKKYG